MHRSVARNLLLGDKRGVRDPVGFGAKPETNANFQLRRGDMHPCPPLATPLRVHECDRQTDRQTDHARIHLPPTNKTVTILMVTACS